MSAFTEFRTYTVGELLREEAIVEILDGNHGELHPTSEDYVPVGIPFIMASDLNGNVLNLISCKFITEERSTRLRKGFAKTGDVLLTHKGTLGSVAIVPDVSPYIVLTPQVTYYRTNELKLHNRFLIYVFMNPTFQEQMRGIAREGTRPYLGITAQRDLQIKLPALRTQKRIANILSNYDRLIDNNSRRIALLEESIHLLYQEWFVRSRFPGYEEVEVVDGVPEGWERKSLKDIATLNYGKSLTKEERKPGSIPVYGSSGVVGYHNKALIEKPGIIVGRKGNIGTVYWCPTSFYPIDTVYYIDSSETSFFLYHTLVNLTFISTDAAVPGLNRNYAYSLPVLVPSNSLQQHFEALAIPIYQQIHTLQTQNQKLKEGRDRLLPRLMNGSITV